MTDNLDIHPDFRAIKARQLTLKRTPLAILNGILSLVNRIKSRKFGSIIAREAIAAPDGHRVPLLRIRPEGVPSPAPALVYYHGGAFIMKHAPQHIANAVRYAREANCCVIFVDYRLAPKWPFPAGFDDCFAALRWTFDNAATLGIDAQRIAVGGDSAGGTFAAAAAQRAVQEERIRLCGQLLIYPLTDGDDSWPSAAAFASVPPFKSMSRAPLWEAYVGHAFVAGMPRYAAPLHGESSGVAPAYVETAEFDPLHDEGIAYADALRARGVDVTSRDVAGAVHGFDLLAPGSAISQSAVDARTGFLREVFRTADPSGPGAAAGFRPRAEAAGAVAP